MFSRGFALAARYEDGRVILHDFGNHFSRHPFRYSSRQVRSFLVGDPSHPGRCRIIGRFETSPNLINLWNSLPQGCGDGH